MARTLLDQDPTPANAEWITTLIHAIVMILFGASIIRAVTTFETWRGWQIAVPVEVGLVLAILTGAIALLTVVNLALRGLGAPFALALSRRLAVDWFYAWTRNPMVLATLIFLVALGVWFQSALFILWVCFLMTPALLFFVKVFEERELEIRFGDAYLSYRSQTPMLVPRQPQPERRGPKDKALKGRRKRDFPSAPGSRTTGKRGRQ
jgi:protein-S-isoprenylcysteine O-methyltransferase Ste14